MSLFDCMACYPHLCRCQQPKAFSDIGERKANQLLEQGFVQCGTMLEDGNGARVTVDKYGRVQWWRVLDDGSLAPKIAHDNQPGDAYDMVQRDEMRLFL